MQRAKQIYKPTKSNEKHDRGKFVYLAYSLGLFIQNAALSQRSQLCTFRLCTPLFALAYIMYFV